MGYLRVAFFCLFPYENTLHMCAVSDARVVDHGGYTSLRNAAWLVRAARHGKENNPVALAVVVAECVRLVSVGEELGDVVEALCELLVHP